jgi:hypothetical protein
MTTILERLAATDLISLAEWLVSEEAQVVCLAPQERLGVLQMLTSRLTLDFRQVSPEDWPCVSDAFDSALGLAGLDQDENLIRRLNLMSVLLRHVSSRNDIAILDPERAVESFFGTVPVSLGDARRLVPQWRTEGIDNIRRLRVAKNMLTPLASFSQLLSGSRSIARLNEWLELMPRLP